MLQRLFITLLFLPTIAFAQVNGGEKIFSFLQLSQSPHITALGGSTVVNASKDVMLATSNPALLTENFHGQLGLNYNFFYAKSKVSNAFYAFHNKKLKTNFGVGIHYFDYGTFQQTDDIGNIIGSMKANDYALQISASRKYLNKWQYGATLKMAHSNLFTQKATAIVSDMGVSYSDTMNKLYVGAVIKNAGFTIQNYEKGVNQPLPLDLQIGILKKFKKAPFSISLTAHHLTQWNIRYDNPADKVNNQLLFNDSSTAIKQKSYFADKLFRHLIFGVEINLGKRLLISTGYNHLRRSELAIDEKKALSGFSMGVGMYLPKFTIHYAKSFYHIAGAYNEIGMNFNLQKLFGMK